MNDYENITGNEIASERSFPEMSTMTQQEQHDGESLYGLSISNKFTVESSFLSSLSSASITDKWQRSMSLSTLSLYSLQDDDFLLHNVHHSSLQHHHDDDDDGVEVLEDKSFTSSNSNSTTDLGYCSTPTSDSSSPDHHDGQTKTFEHVSNHHRTRPVLVTAI